MKKLITLLAFLIPLPFLTGFAISIAAQTVNCEQILADAHKAADNKQYKEAVLKYLAAQKACPTTRDQEIKGYVLEVFNKIDALKRKAEDAEKAAKTNLQKAKDAEGKALAEQTKAKTAEENTKKALEKLQETAKDAVSILLAEIDRDIIRLEYDSTFKKCQTAVKLEENKDEVKKRLLEIAYFYTETDTVEAAIRTLKLLNINSLANREDLLKTIRQNSPPQYFTFLEERYYPKMMPVEGDTFSMRDDTLKYVVRVNDFKMAQTETTFFQYNLFAKATHHYISNPSWQFAGDNPAVNVSWYDAAFYLNWLSERRGLKKVYELTNENRGDYDVNIDTQAKGYRLPTEAEWEFAARGGNKTHGFEYSGDSVLTNVAWYDDNSNSRTHTVATKKANELGLYDMSGNVWEWCNDWYSRRFNISSDKMWISPLKGGSRSLRGGAWGYDNDYSRVSNRDNYFAVIRINIYGFRVCCWFAG